VPHGREKRGRKLRARNWEAVKAPPLFESVVRNPGNGRIAFCSMAVDLHVTQVVDYTLGIHAMIPKACFVGKQYARKNTLLLRA
jgi:hypothetical protein